MSFGYFHIYLYKTTRIFLDIVHHEWKIIRSKLVLAINVFQSSRPYQYKSIECREYS